MIKNEKGFTLVELAIVLVIIGIIIGAVLKGQDLIESARHKQIVNELKKWELATWAYLDMYARFPGDSERSGVIADTTGENPKTDFIDSVLVGKPNDHKITIGGRVFHMFAGNAGAAPDRRNVLVICPDSACEMAFGENYSYALALDSSVDQADGGMTGTIRGTSAALATVTPANWSVTNDTAVTHEDFGPTTRAVLYYFDRQPAS